tara:strand:+ start:2667 stop:2936 length:270 start_codon:yes stop_codon:yes gene_type:complete
MSIENLLRDALEETGASLNLATDEAIRIVALEGARLAAASAEPGFALVLRASRDVVALKLGLNASLEARAADARLVGIIQSVLMGIATA